MLQDDDEQSLFGSPPPSPVTGRSSSPALALPGRSTGTGLVSSAKNVGTIALPGSQPRSELAINPLASPLSTTPRPPAQIQAEPPARLPSRGSGSSSATFLRSSSVTRASRPGRQRTRQKTVESRPPPPQIPLPDPSEPVPVNFLRNQSALLGTAGLVSGVKPSTLAQRHARGTTSANPIIVEEDMPSLSRKYRKPYYANIDPSTLPPPSNGDIVQMLVRQKNIFPLLHSILKLVSESPTQLLGSRPTGFEKRTTRSSTSGVTSEPTEPQEPPVKKRKLRCVPAGAKDWDVPYPFQEGEGPEEYRKTWIEDRGRQLIIQLRNLIRDAARTTAVKNYIEQEEWRKFQERKRREQMALGQIPGCDKPSPYYRLCTTKYGSTPSTVELNKTSEVLTDTSNNTTKSCSPVLQPLPPDSQDTNESSFDQLISSLLSASSTSSEDLTGSSSGHPAVTPSQDTEVDPALLESWVSIFESFPLPEGGASTLEELCRIPNAPMSTSNQFPSSSGMPLDFDTLPFFSPSTNIPPSSSVDLISAQYSHDVTSEFDFSTSNVVENPSQPENRSHDLSITPSNDLQLNTGSLYSDVAIDPNLLALDIPAILDASSSISSWEGSTPSLSHSGSPMPSTLDLGPLTPNSAICDQSLPEIVTDSRGSVGLSSQDGVYDRGDKSKGKEKQRESQGLPDLLRLNPLLTAPPTYVPVQPSPFIGSDKLLKRDEILSRARERRKQLAEEIVKVRTELWETTIEQGVLSYLSKHYK